MPAGAPRMTAPPSFSTRWRVRAGYPAALVYLWLAHPTRPSLAVGAAIAVLGLLLRGAAAGHLRKREALATSGPYAWTRNPLYLGSALLAGGLLVAGRTWLGAALVVAYFAVFYPAVMRHEEQELRAQYGPVFDDYSGRVPLFWPRPPRDRAGESVRFSWQRYLQNREYEATLGVLAGLLLLALRMRWGR